jgi:hypothetical protein
MLFSYWSFKIVLSIFDSARAPLVISHHRWDFPHRWWNMFTFDVTSFDARSGVLLLVLTGTVSIFESLAKIYIFTLLA